MMDWSGVDYLWIIGFTWEEVKCWQIVIFEWTIPYILVYISI